MPEDEQLKISSFSSKTPAVASSSNQVGPCSNIPNSESSNGMNFLHSQRRHNRGRGRSREVNDDDIPPELKIIDDMGNFKCVEKSQKKNYHSQLQKYFHTKTRLLPEFPLTQQLNVIACPVERIESINSLVEKVVCKGNISSHENAPGQKTNETKAQFNHLNPFNLDLNALSEYQQKKYEREKLENFEHYQTIASERKTKALEIEVMQEMRNEKFQLPKFFRVDGRVNSRLAGKFAYLLKQKLV